MCRVLKQKVIISNAVKKTIQHGVITNSITNPERKWLLNFSLSDIPDWVYGASLFFKKEITNIPYEHIVIDLYIFLTQDKIKYKVKKQNKWWFDILTCNEMQVFRQISLNRFNLGKLLANVLARYIHTDIQQILNSKRSFDYNLQNIKQKLNIIKNGIVTQHNLNMIEEWCFPDKNIQNINISETDKQKIKGIADILKKYYTTQNKTQSKNNYPMEIDTTFAHSYLFLDKISRGFTILNNRNKTIKLDLYIDISSSMVGYKYDLAKTIILYLKKIGVKFRNIFAFNITLHKTILNKVLSGNIGGETNLKNVLDTIKTINYPALIISDLEDNNYNFKELLSFNNIVIIFVGKKQISLCLDKYIKQKFINIRGN